MRRLSTTLIAVGSAAALVLVPSTVASAMGNPDHLQLTRGSVMTDEIRVTGTASPELTALLTRLREEERMAHDLYAAFASAYPASRPLQRIVASEQRHFDAVGRLLTAYSVTDPSAGREAGSYADAQLQSLYDQWKAQGSTSRLGALKAAVELEKADIADLEKAVAATTEPDVLRVLNRLLTASRRHLEAYSRAVENLETRGTDTMPGQGQGRGAGQGQGQGTGQGRGQAETGRSTR